jgi:hypothetical protein
MGDLCFGESFHALEQIEEGVHPWLKLVFSSLFMATIGRAINHWPRLARVTSRFAPKDVVEGAADVKRLSTAKAAARAGMKVARPDFMSAVLKPDSGVSQSTKSDLKCPAVQPMDRPTPET